MSHRVALLEGRITGTSSTSLNFDFYSCDTSILTSTSPGATTDTTTSGIDDVVSVLRSDVDAIFDGCTTFWLPASNFEPRTSFERLAKQIFDFHTKDLKANSGSEIDWNKSGAEYWTQKRDLSKNVSASSGSRSNDGVLRNDDTMIRFHFDKDEELVDQTDGDITVHPQLSTITYLTDGGNPTLIFPHRQVPVATSGEEIEDSNDEGDNEDIDQGGIRDGGNESDNNFCEDNNESSGISEGKQLQVQEDIELSSVFVSYPKLGKHVSFDGRFLHGCPSTLSIEDPPDGIRMTFLVNIWINWKPLGPEIFATEDLHLLSNVPVKLENLNSKAVNTTSEVTQKTLLPYSHVDMDDIKSIQSCTAYFGPQGWDKTLSFDWPKTCDMQVQLSKSGRSSFCFRSSPSKPYRIQQTMRPIMNTIPSIEYNINISFQDIQNLFQSSKLVLIKNCIITTDSANATRASPLSQLSELYRLFPKETKAGWCVNKKKSSKGLQKSWSSPESFFADNRDISIIDEASQQSKKRRKLNSVKSSTPWEINFQVTSESNPEAFGHTRKVYCHVAPTLFSVDNNESRICISFGNNSISSTKVKKIPNESFSQDNDDSNEGADGTFYHQLWGSRTCLFYPDESQDWICGPPPITPGDKPLSVEVCPGDVILVNKKFWNCAYSSSGDMDLDSLFYFIASQDFMFKK